MMHYFDIGAGKHFLAEFTIIVFVKDYDCDSCLNDNLCAEQTRETCGVNGTAKGSRSTCLNNCGFLSMQTFALIQLLTLRHVRVASRTSTFVAILMLEWSAVVTS